MEAFKGVKGLVLLAAIKRCPEHANADPESMCGTKKLRHIAFVAVGPHAAPVQQNITSQQQDHGNHNIRLDTPNVRAQRGAAAGSLFCGM